MPGSEAQKRTLSPPSFRAGRLTRLVLQRKDPNRVSVYIDDQFAFGLHQDLIAEHRIAKGDLLSVERQEELVRADQHLRAYRKVLHFIGYRPRTEYEVRRKMQALELDEALTSDIIDRLYKYHYLDDAQYARTYVRARLSSKGYGPRRIRQELTKKGISRSVAEDMLEELVQPEDLFEKAQALAEKRWARLERETDLRKRRKKVSDFLVRRGYTWDMVKQVLEELEV